MFRCSSAGIFRRIRISLSLQAVHRAAPPCGTAIKHVRVDHRGLDIGVGDLAAGQVDVLDAQLQAYHQAQPGPVHERGHEPLVAGELRKHGFDLVAGHDHRNMLGPTGTDDLAKVARFAADDVAIKEQQGR